MTGSGAEAEIQRGLTAGLSKLAAEMQGGLRFVESTPSPEEVLDLRLLHGPDRLVAIRFTQRQGFLGGTGHRQNRGRGDWEDHAPLSTCCSLDSGTACHPGRNIIIESAFDVGRRFCRTMRVDCGQRRGDSARTRALPGYPIADTERSR
jgi:hypothetical protein